MSIKYSKERAREKRERVSNIENMLRTCEENCSKRPSNENFEQLEVLNLNMMIFIEISLKGRSSDRKLLGMKKEREVINTF